MFTKLKNSKETINLYAVNKPMEFKKFIARYGLAFIAWIFAILICVSFSNHHVLYNIFGGIAWSSFPLYLMYRFCCWAISIVR